MRSQIRLEWCLCANNWGSTGLNILWIEAPVDFPSFYISISSTGCALKLHWHTIITPHPHLHLCIIMSTPRPHPPTKIRNQLENSHCLCSLAFLYCWFTNSSSNYLSYSPIHPPLLLLLLLIMPIRPTHLRGIYTLVGEGGSLLATQRRTVESTRRGLPQLDSCAKQLVAADRSFRADPPCVRREFILFNKVWGTIVFYKSPIPVSDK